MKEKEVMNLREWGTWDEREGTLCTYILIFKNYKNLNKKLGERKKKKRTVEAVLQLEY